MKRLRSLRMLFGSVAPCLVLVACLDTQESTVLPVLSDPRTTLSPPAEWRTEISHLTTEFEKELNRTSAQSDGRNGPASRVDYLFTLRRVLHADAIRSYKDPGRFTRMIDAHLLHILDSMPDSPKVREARSVLSSNLDGQADVAIAQRIRRASRFLNPDGMPSRPFAVQVDTFDTFVGGVDPIIERAMHYVEDSTEMASWILVETSNRLPAALSATFAPSHFMLEAMEAIVDSHVVFWEEEAVFLYLEEGAPIALRASLSMSPGMMGNVPAVPLAIAILGRAGWGAVAGCTTGVLHFIAQGTLEGTAWSTDAAQRAENLQGAWGQCKYMALVGAAGNAGLGKWWSRITGSGRTPPG